jgi:hypothetical protein
MECISNITVAHCGCLPLHLPGRRTVGDLKIPFCGASSHDCVQSGLRDHYEQVSIL